ncbi:hypothetical protein [Treponema sp. R6D11]
MRSNDPCPKCAGAKSCRGRKPEQGFAEAEPTEGRRSSYRLLSVETAIANNLFTCYQLTNSPCLLGIIILNNLCSHIKLNICYHIFYNL